METYHAIFVNNSSVITLAIPASHFYFINA